MEFGKYRKFATMVQFPVPGSVRRDRGNKLNFLNDCVWRAAPKAEPEITTHSSEFDGLAGQVHNGICIRENCDMQRKGKFLFTFFSFLAW